MFLYNEKKDILIITGLTNSIPMPLDAAEKIIWRRNTVIEVFQKLDPEGSGNNRIVKSPNNCVIYPLTQPQVANQQKNAPTCRLMKWPWYPRTLHKQYMVLHGISLCYNDTTSTWIQVSGICYSYPGYIQIGAIVNRDMASPILSFFNQKPDILYLF